VQVDAPGFKRIGSEDQAHRLGPARTHQARHPEDLAAIGLERHVANLRARPQPHRAKGQRPPPPARRKSVSVQVAPDHEANHVIRIPPCRIASGHDLAVSQHGDTVGNPKHFLDPVRNVDDPDPVGLESGDLGEKQLHLAVGQRRGRLIERQDAAPP